MFLRPGLPLSEGQDTPLISELLSRGPALVQGLINMKYNIINFRMYWHVPKSVGTTICKISFRPEEGFFLLLSLKTVHRFLKYWLIISSKKKKTNKRICDVYFYQQLQWPKKCNKVWEDEPCNFNLNALSILPRFRHHLPKAASFVGPLKFAARCPHVRSLLSKKLSERRLTTKITISYRDLSTSVLI